MLTGTPAPSVIAAVAVLASAAPAAHGGPVLFVDDDAPPGGDGLSWNTAFRHLQDALTAASAGGVDEIRAGQGLYRPDRSEAVPDGNGDRAASFDLVDGTDLRGGYAGFGAPDPDARDPETFETVLSGDLAGDDGPGFANAAENSFQVVRAVAGQVAGLDGLVVTAGNADGRAPAERGGGLYADDASLTITACRFVANRALTNSNGGGVHLLEGSAEITDCRFVANRSSNGFGGGLRTFFADVTLAGCAFEDNDARFGGGLAIAAGDWSASGCTFSGNLASERGGGADLASGDGEMSACTFTGNVADNGGGANLSGATRLAGCMFLDNVAVGLGGAVRVAKTSSLLNSVFRGNDAAGGGAVFASNEGLVLANGLFTGNTAIIGGAIFALEDSSLHVLGCTIVNNAAEDGGGALHAEGTSNSGSGIFVRSSILRSNGLELFASKVFLSVEYCNVAGGQTGEGNINVDPLFVDPDGPDDVPGSDDDDFRLATGSPCIDAGSSFFFAQDDADLDDDGDFDEPIPFDLAGEDRFVDDPATPDSGEGDAPIIDMGAFEFQGPGGGADVNGDGVVDVDDLVAVILGWS